MKKKIVLLLLAFIILLAIVFSGEIEDLISCLAYYDQCTAERLEGLTKDECLKRNDAVAFLFEGDVCLIKKK